MTDALDSELEIEKTSTALTSFQYDANQFSFSAEHWHKVKTNGKIRPRTYRPHYLRRLASFAMLCSPQTALVLCARSMKVATHRVPITVSAVQIQTQCFSTEPAKPKKKVERGVLFSAPCLDPEIRLAAEERLVAVESVVSVKPTKVEKGFLFSAPCLEMNRDGQLKETEEK
jgi:hypothetical protein